MNKPTNGRPYLSDAFRPEGDPLRNTTPQKSTSVPILKVLEAHRAEQTRLANQGPVGRLVEGVRTAVKEKWSDLKFRLGL